MTRHREKAELFVATNTAADVAQLARQMARVDERRAASQFFPQQRYPAGDGGLAAGHAEASRRSPSSARQSEPASEPRAGEGGRQPEEDRLRAIREIAAAAHAREEAEREADEEPDREQGMGR